MNDSWADIEYPASQYRHTMAHNLFGRTPAVSKQRRRFQEPSSGAALSSIFHDSTIHGWRGSLQQNDTGPSRYKLMAWPASGRLQVPLRCPANSLPRQRPNSDLTGAGKKAGACPDEAQSTAEAVGFWKVRGALHVALAMRMRNPTCRQMHRAGMPAWVCGRGLWTAIANGKLNVRNGHRGSQQQRPGDELRLGCCTV
jgi:hypothetical protein